MTEALFHLTKVRRWAARVVAAALVTTRLPMPAETVTEWELDRGGTSISGASTSTVTLGDGSKDDVDNVAVSGMLSGTLSMVVPGDMILMEGSASFDGVSSGNAANEFRFGLFDSNGSTGTGGWLGYSVGDSDRNRPGSLWERNDGSAAGYFSSAGTSELTTERAAGNGDFLSGTYSFSLQLTRLATDTLLITFSLTSGSGYSMSGTYTDTTAQTFSYDRVGFAAGNSLNADQVTLSGVTVNYVSYLSPVPEPGVGLLVGMGALALGLRRQRR